MAIARPHGTVRTPSSLGKWAIRVGGSHEELPGKSDNGREVLRIRVLSRVVESILNHITNLVPNVD